MEQIKVNPNNKKYYSEDFIKGFKCGVKRQFKVDRKEGEWINQKQGAFYPVECSNCHKQPLFNEDEDYEYTKYCPYCGCRMKGADNE